MPFVQRVVSPTYLSRSRPRSRAFHNGSGPRARSPAIRNPKLSPGTSAGSGCNGVPSESATASHVKGGEHQTTAGTTPGNIGAHFDPHTSSSVVNGRDLIVVNGAPISSGAIEAVHSSVALFNGGASSTTTTGKSGSGGTVPLSAPLSVACRSTTSSPVVTGHEFESVTNITLSNALRQLASLVLIANDIFTELNAELQAIGERSKGISHRIVVLEQKVEQFDPKLVPVPESDLETFVHIKNHFKSIRPVDKELFTPETRSFNLRQQYEAAAKIQNSSARELDDLSGEQEAELVWTPVFEQKFRKMRSRIDVEIETRMPAAVEELRKWTSSEALGDITVTPDCISRVRHNTSIMNNSTFNSSNVNGQGNVSSVSPSRNVQLQTANVATVGYSIDVTDNNSTVIGAAQLSSSSSSNNNRTANEDDDLPLDHRLPSPEEQCQIIAMKFPAEVITVDVTGRRFQRMCTARKSMTNYIAIGDHNNLNDDVQTVKRRSRSRKPRGKRRNTIAGTDQREIEEAANGDSQLSPTHGLSEAVASSKVGRSKSSDVLKKDSPPSFSTLQNGANGNADSGKTTLTRFNSLKQWGRNRLRWMQRNGDDKDVEKERDRDRDKDKVLDIDNEESNACETVVISGKAKKKLIEKERKLSHERKPSYSSTSEKSLSLMSHPVKINGTNAASINPVKMRETSSLRRQRRNSGLDHKDEPHSSSGNWSASSESGRTSIGSEITVQPKSSASSTSLNHSNLHSGSGPPSSIISRRRFLNTSASSSVTSEGTATPDLQVHDLFYDDETSSAYSCDTEGYYTSFHVDSGLKTLKEEEPMTPLHSTSALSSTTSFSSTINQTVLTAESEYELFGRGSTSTTTSSAGTVCTTLMATDTDRGSMHGLSPAVPERKSSLTKLNRSNSNASGGTLERSYSSSTVGSTLERTGTIKRNGVLLQKEVAAVIHQDKAKTEERTSRIDSPDSGNNTSSSPIETNSNESPTQGMRSNSEFEYSECSDLEGVDRIERIRVKTAINSSRIPSMCVITPTTSDDETVKDCMVRTRERVDLPVNVPDQSPPLPLPPQETDLDTIDFGAETRNENNNLDKVQIKEDAAGYVTVPAVTGQNLLKPVEIRKDANFNNFRKTTLQPLNTMLGKLKGVLPHLKKASPNKESSAASDTCNESLYDTAGEYVTIADVRNNNNNTHKRTTGNGIYYSNDVVKRNLATVLSGNLNQETEYVSLNELPCSIRCDGSPSITGNILLPGGIDTNDQTERAKAAPAGEKGEVSLASGNVAVIASTSNIIRKDTSGSQQREELQRQRNDGQQHPQIRGARVTFDAQGKVVYNSDSLKRRKGAHTTFAPGPCVKDPVSSALSSVVAATSLNASASANTPTASICVSESNLASGSSAVGSSLTRKKDIVVRPVVSQKANLLVTTASQNVDMATDILSGRYIRDKVQIIPDSRDNPLALQPSVTSSVSGTTYHCAQFGVGDYQRLSHNERLQHYEQLAHQTQVAEKIRYGSPEQITSDPANVAYASSGRYSPATVTGSSPFQRNNHVYWTLQHRRQPIATTLARDDSNVAAAVRGAVNVNELYATPNKIRNREVLKTTPLGFNAFFSPIKTNNTESNISPIDPRNVAGFKTSTPSKPVSPSRGLLSDELRQRLQIQNGTRSYNASPSSSGRSTPLRGIVEQQQPRLRHSWAPETPELPKTCSDRFGTQKTSLMDFKKLLLSKSSKTAPGSKKSAVEMLKVNKNENVTPGASVAAAPVLNSSMNILDLSGSPKTFANRRMIRQGNFGSPSKSLGTKQRNTWRINASRTDVMSTAIPEANSEEDASSSHSSAGSGGRRSPNINKGISPATSSSSSSPSPLPTSEKTVIDDNINLKTNIFLQAEENNFMKGETRNASGLARNQLAQARAQFLMGTKGYMSDNKDQNFDASRKPVYNTASSSKLRAPNDQPTFVSNKDGAPKSDNESNSQPITSAPSLETAL